MTTRLWLGLAAATVAAALGGCSSSNSLAGSVDGRASDPDAGAGGCVCDDGERNRCATLEQLCQYAHPSECNRGSTLEQVLASGDVNWIQVGCGLRLVGHPTWSDRGFAYLFDAETGELKGGAFTSDYSLGQCPSVNSYFGDTSRFDMFVGLVCDQKVVCDPDYYRKPAAQVIAPCLPGAGVLDAGP